jgi:hypothetical protein
LSVAEAHALLLASVEDEVDCDVDGHCSFDRLVRVDELLKKWYVYKEGLMMVMMGRKGRSGERKESMKKDL